jgi:tetratricopeptide (TPR) repeat protein
MPDATETYSDKPAETPAKSSQTSTPAPGDPSLLQALIAAGFGFVFVSVLLVIAYITPNPSPYQEWTYRVVMSLAAGGIGAIIPGLLSFNSPWVKAGGAMACFAIVYLLNPPSIASQQLRSQAYFDLMDRGNSALARGNLSQAKFLYAAAIVAAPAAYVPYQKLADAEFESGEYKNAELDYKKAYELSAKQVSDAPILYNTALSEEGLKDYPQAVQTFEAVASMIQQNPNYLQDVRFSIAQLQLKIWKGETANSDPYNKAVDGFKAFLEANEDPPYFAHYHLACLYAMQSDLLPEDRRSQLKHNATTELETTIDELKESSAKRAELHKKMLRDLLTKEAVNSLPGDPVFCPALQTLTRGLSRERLQILQDL